ncbi:hypothetical protein [Komagataeibacter swingsii]|uniref:Uncharacterized protein n=1 Tax=Komagataeibacter swingsii TaxID=215220 RepID=A0A850P0D4_9PROT|nr:hypothetical protein [Komagataeibacter swingsii]NVN36593.1 hypothetical protein [Komagataeibacter swingsii]
MKLFSKSFEECRLFEKRQHPKTFIIFYQRVIRIKSLRLRGSMMKGRGG